MSSSYEYSYALERRLSRQIYLARVSDTTEQFYQRYEKQYEDMKAKGYAAYIPEEMERLGADLSSIRNTLGSNPERARDISFEVGAYIRSIHWCLLQRLNMIEQKDCASRTGGLSEKTEAID